MPKQTPSTEILTITPAMARSWLDASSFDNRRLSDERVAKIVSDIKEGRWVFDGTPIRFNGKDNVLDGQHRLYAIIRSETPVTSLVVRGLESESKNTIDTGKARSISDVLHFNGHINATSLAAAARLVIAYRQYDGDLSHWATSGMSAAISDRVIIQEASENDDLVNAVQTVISLRHVKKLAGVGTTAFCYYLFAGLTARHIADSFFQALEHGNELDAESPILLLRNTLAFRDSKTGVAGQRKSAYNAALFIKAWNAWRSGKVARQLKYSREESFPTPIA